MSVLDLWELLRHYFELLPQCRNSYWRGDGVESRLQCESLVFPSGLHEQTKKDPRKLYCNYLWHLEALLHHRE